MSVAELKRKHKEVSIRILKSYQKEDRVVVIHENDNDLDEIRVKLPKAPSLEKIYGFGKKAVSQKFYREEIPPKLKTLVKDLTTEKRSKTTKPNEVYITVEEIWDFLKRNKKEYKDEIYFIKKQWYHRIYGAWYFINGKPTYICGWHWFFLCYYEFHDGGRPFYKDRDRRWFLVQEHLFYETRDEKGIDYKRPLHRGTNNLDGRRFGKTSRVDSILLNLSTMSLNWECGIQGLDKETGVSVFQKHVIYPFRKLPFYFLPSYEGTTDVKTKLTMKPAGIAIGGKGTVIDDREGLETVIDFASTADKSYYDKRKLNFYHCDEPGKLTLEDAYKRHEVVKECVAQGTNIIGWMMYTTTVEETKIESMEAYTKLCDGSHYGGRVNGETSTGLINVFMSAADGLEGFVDEYGSSIIETPKRPLKGIDGRWINIGSLEYIENKRDSYKKDGNFDGLAGFKRRFPLNFRECFTPSASDSSFNMEIIETRLTELKFADKSPIVNGDLYWTNGFGSNVEFSGRTDGKGKWNISRKPLPHQKNQRYMDDEIYCPRNSVFTIGVDPFKFSKTKHRRKSDGGIAVGLNYDPIKEEGKDIKEWETDDLVCTYENRPDTTDEFSEDVLMTAIYYSGVVFSERNVDTVIKDFERWKYKGYLLHEIYLDKNGIERISDTPGFNISGEGPKQKLMRNIKDMIQLHGLRCKHADFLTSCTRLRGIEDMTNHDLFSAVALMREGMKSDFSRRMEEFNVGLDYDLIYPKKKYRNFS
jgi:hypothetical protein